MQVQRDEMARKMTIDCNTREQNGHHDDQLQDAIDQAQELLKKTSETRVSRLLVMKEKMEELKARSNSLDNLWATYETMTCQEEKATMREKIKQKTVHADELASHIFRTIEIEEAKKSIILAKSQIDIALSRSPVPSPSPRSKKTFF